MGILQNDFSEEFGINKCHNFRHSNTVCSSLQWLRELTQKAEVYILLP
jgi:hypothetical protein